MDAIITQNPNVTITNYCKRQGLGLNTTDYEVAIMIRGHAIFRPDCPNLASVYSRHMPAMLDVGRMHSSSSHLDDSLFVCPKYFAWLLDLAPGMAQREIEGRNIPIGQMDPIHNWVMELPGAKRHWAQVINYGTLVPSQKDVRLFSEEGISYPKAERAFFPQAGGHYVEDLRFSMSCDDDLVVRDTYRLKDKEIEGVILDVGANVGSFSLFAARRWPKTTIYAFEPLAENFENLLRNIKRSGYKNIVPFNLAITGDGRQVYVSSQGDMTSLSSIYGNPINQLCYVNSADSITLDRFLEENSIQDVALLKIDAEGSEYEILYSFTGINRVKYLVAEVHSKPLGGWDIADPRWSPSALAEWATKNISGEFHFTYCK